MPVIKQGYIDPSRGEIRGEIRVEPSWKPLRVYTPSVVPPVLPITQITGYTKCAICKALLLHHDVIAHDKWHDALNVALDL